MMTTIAFALALLPQPAPSQPRSVEWPELQPPGLYEYGVPVAVDAVVSQDSPIPWAYGVGVDPAVPVQAEELDADIYVGEP